MSKFVKKGQNNKNINYGRPLCVSTKAKGGGGGAERQGEECKREVELQQK